ncbi:hypothetical protein, partial [uncultured Methanofollis sp.]|uniref:hypothetical protein n=1 Tax=uncultured Methanofollis sp. TaxID=262500 RepID=UPI00261C5ECA
AGPPAEADQEGINFLFFFWNTEESAFVFPNALCHHCCFIRVWILDVASQEINVVRDHSSISFLSMVPGSFSCRPGKGDHFGDVNKMV